MCSARRARLVRRGSRAAPGRRATAPARPVNNEGQQDQSAADNPIGSGADGGSKQPRRRPTPPPDDRLTTILPPVKDDAPNPIRDPLAAVKAALDVPPASRSADSRDSLDMASAALDSKTSRRQEKPAGGSGGPPAGGPPGGRPPGPPGREPPPRRGDPGAAARRARRGGSLRCRAGLSEPTGTGCTTSTGRGSVAGSTSAP